MSRSDREPMMAIRLLVPPAFGERPASGVHETLPRPTTDHTAPREWRHSFLTVLLRALSAWAA